jgi:1,4-dihydroxy-2-naphthoate polyprenyltransferase
VLLALLIIALLHAAANVLNDVYDELNGADRLNTQRIYPTPVDHALCRKVS